VAHVGQELALGPGRLHRLISGLGQAIDQLGQFLLALFDLGYFGVDRDKATILGAAFAAL
jgi:hypothetical protein